LTAEAASLAETYPAGDAPSLLAGALDETDSSEVPPSRSSRTAISGRLARRIAAAAVLLAVCVIGSENATAPNSGNQNASVAVAVADDSNGSASLALGDGVENRNGSFATDFTNGSIARFASNSGESVGETSVRFHFATTPTSDDAIAPIVPIRATAELFQNLTAPEQEAFLDLLERQSLALRDLSI
jgi:hypothetical protein